MIIMKSELPAWLIEQLNNAAQQHEEERPRLHRHTTIETDDLVKDADKDNHETIINIPLYDVESGYST